jgi:hypothetical protein
MTEENKIPEIIKTETHYYQVRTPIASHMSHKTGEEWIKKKYIYLKLHRSLRHEKHAVNLTLRASRPVSNM